MKARNFKKKVAFDLGLKNEHVWTDDRNAEINLNQWQKFWEVHSMHYDSDARVMSSIAAYCQPDSQSVTLSIGEDVKKRDDSRWNMNYKHRFSLSDETYPGPFGELKTGTNNFSIYKGLPPVERGELPDADVFN